MDSNKPRTKGELQSQFLKELYQIIEMEGFQKQIPIIIVEGEFDNDLFSKIRIPGQVNIVSVKTALDATIGEVKGEKTTKKEKNKLSNKDQVRHAASNLIELGYIAIGIQDSDLDGIKNIFSRGEFKSPSHSKAIIQTYPSRDMETMLYSVLQKKGAFSSFPKELEQCISKAMNLAYLGIAINQFNKKSKLDKNFGLSGFCWDMKSKKMKLYSQICNSLDKLLSEYKNSEMKNLEPNLLDLLETEVNNVVEKINQLKLNWSEFVRGHDLETFVIHYNEDSLNSLKKYYKEMLDNLNKKLLRRVLGYHFINHHPMFVNLEQWRHEKQLPELFD